VLESGGIIKPREPAILSCSLISAAVAATFLASGANPVAAQGTELPYPSSHLTTCVQDPGGASVADTCFRLEDGTFNLIYRQDLLEATVASEDYRLLIAAACKAMNISEEDCDITPMFVPIGENAIAGECDSAKVILFDPNIVDFFGPSGTKFAIYHEIGHHFCGHLGGLCAAREELEADVFAGAAMRRLGFPFSDTLSVLEVLKEEASDAYPGRRERAKAIETGWRTPAIAYECQ